MARQHVRCFDLMRCAAAVAVIAIHVMAPYRDQIGVIPFSEWATALSINGMSRWAVPVFILVTGALLLSDNRPFDFRYYVRRRLGKVLVPFVIWSLFYAWLSGLSANGYSLDATQSALFNSPHEATYYHLGFFYYFIPLYFIAPLFQWLIKKQHDIVLYSYVSLWLVTTGLYLFYVDGPWDINIWLYSGYLPLGYLLFKKVPTNQATTALFLTLGTAAIATTVIVVAQLSLSNGEYRYERWLSYKTLNVVLAASMIFMLGKALADRLSEKAYTVVQFVSRYSLGIYILHPVFLWPMKEFGWHQGHPAWVIPVWVILSGSGALGVSWLVAQSRSTRWLLP